jgi:SAM-dependent methyltransferase
MSASPYQNPPSPSRPTDTAFLHAVKDHVFDLIYPQAIREQSSCHWSPVNVCRLAAKWLVTSPGTRVLDIGCGPGKFCIVGATTTKGRFTGIEQRSRLARAARDLIQRHAIAQVQIVHGNITEIDFREFEAFYLFNPFQENVFPSLRIDFEVELEPKLYAQYIDHVQRQLVGMPLGTRVATYCGDASEIPAGYECQQQAFDNKLKLWVKVHDTPDLTQKTDSAWASAPTLVGRGPCGLVPG